MFSRISRLISAFFNRFVTAAEDPTLILENNIRELQSQIPMLNEAVAKSHGSVIMLQKQLGVYLEDSQELEEQVKAALQLGKDDAARDLVVKLQDIKSKEERLGKDLELAQMNLQQTQEMRDMKVREIKTKIQEIKGALEDHKFSQLQRQIASVTDTSTSIDMDSVSHSTEEMLGKIRQDTALNQGAFAASLSNSAPEIEQAKIKQAAQGLKADKLLESYRQELGLSTATNRVIEADATQNSTTTSV